MNNFKTFLENKLNYFEAEKKKQVIVVFTGKFQIFHDGHYHSYILATFQLSWLQLCLPKYRFLQDLLKDGQDKLQY